MNINERCCGPLQHVFSELKLRPLLAVVFEIIINNPWPTFKNPNNLTYIHYPGYPVLFHKIPAVILKTIVCTFKVQKIIFSVYSKSAYIQYSTVNLLTLIKIRNWF